MADKKVHRVLSKCKREIIYKFSGNYSYQLKHTDFLLLSDEIAEASKITLSLTTLRRIFKDEYKGIPKISTLNAFALYLGYENWKEYYKQNQTEDHNTPEPVSSKRKYLPSFFIILVSGILVIAVILLIIKPEILFESVEGPEKAEFYCSGFDSSEVPVTVTFHYNLKGMLFDTAALHPLGYADKRWDDVTILNATDSTVTHTYLYPGRFYPKLIVDGAIIAERQINLVTGHWLANISKRNPFYIEYFDDPEIFTGGKLSFSTGVFEKTGFPVSDAEQTCYQIFRSFANVEGDSMFFSTRIRNTLMERSPESGQVELDLFFEGGNIHLVFRHKKSSLNHFGIWIADKYFSTSKEDLSFLFIDLQKWNRIGCKTSRKLFELHTNNELVMKTGYQKDLGKLFGIRYIFNGLGEIDYVRFSDTNSTVLYQDEFD